MTAQLDLITQSDESARLGQAVALLVQWARERRARLAHDASSAPAQPKPLAQDSPQTIDGKRD